MLIYRKGTWDMDNAKVRFGLFYANVMNDLVVVLKDGCRCIEY